MNDLTDCVSIENWINNLNDAELLFWKRDICRVIKLDDASKLWVEIIYSSIIRINTINAYLMRNGVSTAELRTCFTEALSNRLFRELYGEKSEQLRLNETKSRDIDLQIHRLIWSQNLEETKHKMNWLALFYNNPANDPLDIPQNTMWRLVHFNIKRQINSFIEVCTS